MKAVLVTRFRKLPKAVRLHSPDVACQDRSRRRTESPQVSTSDPTFSLEYDDGPSPPTLLTIPYMDRKRSLVRTTSLPSISDYKTPTSEPSLSSATDDSFYPSYLKRPHTRDRKIQDDNVTRLTEEPDLGLPMPISRRRTRPPSSNTTDNAALWDGAGWDSMQHVTQKNAALGEGSPTRTSLAGEWYAMNWGDC
jgi:hypothetical protein